MLLKRVLVVAIFPALLPVLGAAAAKLAGPLLFKILAIIGISVLTYTGIDIALDQMESLIQSEIGGLPADIVAVLGAIKFDVYVTMIFSAMLTRMTVKGLFGGAMKAFRW